ncbi:MAG: hypothetical protein M3Z84_08345 [Actinomycetota bacterium]|nr:hypothetical protein [Actinomycetota bacterium]
MTAAIHGTSKTIVTRLITTTPAATIRADTSFTGLGNENMTPGYPQSRLN